MSDALGVSKKDKLAGIVEIDGSLLRKAAKNVDPSKREEEITEVSTVTMELPEITAEELAELAKKSREDSAEELKQKLASTMTNEIKNDGVTVERAGDEVIIRFPSEIAFPSGSGSLNAGFEQVLDRLAPALKKTPGDLIVSGHTDNIPVRAGVFQSNWDLSASRATAVVHRFLFEHQIDPKRITVQGYGDSRPIASNDTPEGRKKNRRVEVTIISPEKVAKDKAKKKSTSFYDE